MLFPIGDDNTDRHTTPFVTYALIALNIFVFVVFQGCGANNDFTYSYSTVPEEIVSGRDIETNDEPFTDPNTGERYVMPGLGDTPSVYLTLLTSMFMHGGFAHIFGNMLYLWIFGDNVEHRLGHIKFLLFYLVCGVIASLCHVAASYFTNDNMLIPSLGASGAIAGVLGGYLLLFPKRKVRVIMLNMVTQVPALIAVGLWFVFQLVAGLGTIDSAEGGGGVAYMAHIGGFIAGFILVKIFAIGTKPMQEYTMS